MLRAPFILSQTMRQVQLEASGSSIEIANKGSFLLRSRTIHTKILPRAGGPAGLASIPCCGKLPEISRVKQIELAAIER